MPRITVVIPTFNCGSLLPQAIKSVLAQSIDDFETVIVDDGSTDNTKAILDEYVSDSRVRYVYQENRGLPGARNSGVRQSDSEYVAFLDADDELRKDALERMAEQVARDGSAWCLIDIMKCKPSSREIQRTMIPVGDLSYEILRDDFMRRGMFFKRESFLAVGMYDEEMKYREDWDLNIRMFRAGFPYSYVPEPLYLYTWRPGGITTGNREKVLGFTEKVVRKHHKTLADSGDSEARRIYSEVMWGMARQFLYEAHNVNKAFSCARESLTYDFSLGKVVHPLVHHLSRLAARRVRAV